MNLTYTESFRRYGAVLRNNVWSVAALSAKQELVLSMWEQQLRLDAQRKQLIYEDKLSDWLGNDMGRKELRGLLEQAQRDQLTVRMVIAHPVGETAQSQVGQVANESLIRKTFSVRPELQGKVVAFDGDALRIEFSKAAS